MLDLVEIFNQFLNWFEENFKGTLIAWQPTNY